MPEESEPSGSEDGFGASVAPVEQFCCMKVALEDWFRRLAPAVETTVVGNVKTFLAKFGARISHGSICTGCDIVSKAMGVLTDFMKIRYDISVEFQNTFQCEKDPKKKVFLQTHVPTGCLFKTAQEMTKESAFDCLSETSHLVPWVNILSAGFPCTSRTRLSSLSSAQKGCVQGKTGATGETWDEIRQYITRCRPQCVLLENVVPLAEVSEAGRSDADFIVDQLRQMGYWAIFVNFDCQVYGSPADRARLYFLAVADLVDGNGSIEAFVKRLLKSMKVPRFAPAEFVTSSPAVLHKALEDLSVPSVSDREASKRSLSDPHFDDEHCELYRLVDMTWPPQDTTAYLAFAPLGTRIVESVYYVDHVWKPKHAVEFVDLNSSLGRITGRTPGCEF